MARIIIETEDKKQIQATTNTHLFSPNQYSLQKKVNWKENKGRGLDLPQIQYDGGGTRTFSLSLMFDSYESGQDVRQLTREVAKLAEVAEGKDRPPLCKIIWGPTVDPYAGLPFVGVLESLTQKFTLFLADGTPVRATLDVQFKAVESPEKQLKRNPRKRGSPLQPKTRVVEQGDTLWSIAAAEYGNPAKWRSIADTNRILNPRRLESGKTLIIPSLE